MAFLGKLGEIAKNVGEMTNDALENSRKGSQISVENRKIREAKEQIGDYYWEKYKNGEAFGEPVDGLCAQIQASAEVISVLQAEMEAAQRPDEQEASGVRCCSCGHLNSSEVKFCAECGKKLEVPADKFCINCGAKNFTGTKFCAECGMRMEE